MMKSFSAEGIILKRSDVGEADRIVTLFTKEYGKLTAVAKGCRKLSSSKISALEPGTLSRIFLIRTQGLPILTQAQLLDEYAEAKKNLVGMRKVFEVLEILDSLLMEEEGQEEVFMRVKAIFEHLASSQVHSSVIRDHLSSIIEILGFGEKEKMDFTKPLKDFVEEITAKKLKAYAYLSAH